MRPVRRRRAEVHFAAVKFAPSKIVVRMGYGRPNASSRFGNTMKIWKSLGVLTIFAAFCSAQDDAVYSSWMKTMQPSVMAINAAIAAKDNPTVAAEATKMAATFEQVVGFWTQRKTDDAIGFAKAARDAAKALAAATDPDAQTAALRTVQAQCGQCHMAHRGGGRGAFVIK
jgi:hypothetical protein